MNSDNPSRLYLTLPQSFDGEVFAPILRSALAATPIACVRLDLGAAEEEDWIRAANYVIEPCHEADVALVVTDHYRLVEALGLDGVHLSKAARTPMREVRKALGEDVIVGAEAGTSKHNGMVLAEAGADYVSFGPVGDTGALGDDACAGDDLFEWWGEMIETPSVAEGGVTVEDAQRLTAHVDFVVPDRRIWEGPEDIADKLVRYATALA